MVLAEKLKKLIKEAELYLNQGLLSEARQAYLRVADMLEPLDQVKNKTRMIANIRSKVAQIEARQSKLDDAPINPEIKTESQDLIKELFSQRDGQSSDAAALDAAITLTKFGQYDRALTEFKSLLENESVRLAAAKNIIRCHVATGAHEGAIDQFLLWRAEGRFSEDQEEKLRLFIKNLLKKKAVDLDRIDSPANSAAAPAVEHTSDPSSPGMSEEEILDINSIGLTLTSGPKKGEMVELDVSFQTGNVISVLVASRDQILIDQLNVGGRLDQIQFYSPIAIFQGAGIVSAKTLIKVGPRKGDFSIDIKVTQA